MRNIRRSVQHEAVVRQLAEAPHPISGRSLFPTMRELLCFAAVLGFDSGARTQLTGQTNEIDGRIFANHDATLDLMYLLALASTHDVDILREEKEDEMVTLFEEYSETGLRILGGWLHERAEDENGDRAILSALAKYRFLEVPQTVESAISNIKF